MLIGEQIEKPGLIGLPLSSVTLKNVLLPENALLGDELAGDVQFANIIIKTQSHFAGTKALAISSQRRFGDFKFRRQHPVGSYILDFACCSARVVVELDGGQHDLAVAYDTRRTSWLESQGWTVLRF